MYYPFSNGGSSFMTWPVQAFEAPQQQGLGAMYGPQPANNEQPFQKASPDNSKQVLKNEAPHSWTSHFPSSGPLKLAEYQDRLVTSNGTQTVYLASCGCTLRYAYVTQRGYYPEAPDKQNQDSFCVLTNFGGDLEQMFFGVFDGHGENGTPCSQFTRQKLPENFVGDSNFDMYPEVAYHNAFVMTNQQLHASHIDDTMSGTTGITSLLRGKLLYTANVGDSRAVIAERQGAQLVAVDLSMDQTPFRRDECARVKQAGARVLTLDQLEGLKDPNVECWGTEEEDSGDPPRLWAHNGMYPGTAFTRSVGDSAAERIGVIADPEVSIRRVEPNVEFLVIASDGVWEFMSSQRVVDMIDQHGDPQEAALAVTAEAYNLWLQYETRTDDITIIIVRFSGMEETDAATMSGGHDADADLVDPGTPERNTLTRRRTRGSNDALKPMHTLRRGSVDSEENDDEYQPPKPPPKTQSEIQMLEDAVKSNFLFSHLNMMQRLLLFQVMVKRHVVPGEIVIRQGERGDHFYIIEEGKFDVLVAQGDDPPELVHTYNAVNGQHPSFGELSLLYGKPRAATVISRAPGCLWELDRRAFHSVMHKRDPKVIMKLLQNVEVLKPLSTGQLQQVADSLQEATFADGQYIIRQGELGSEFYAIESGEVVCTMKRDPDDASEPEREVLRLGQFQYFGERALVSSESRGANVIAKGKVQLLTISRFELCALIGTLELIKEERQAWLERCHVARELMAQRSVALLETDFSLSDLDCLGILFVEEVLALAAMAVEGLGGFVVRLFSVSDTVALGHQSQIVRASTIARNLKHSLFVPPVVKTLRNQAVMADVLLLDGACPLPALSEGLYTIPEDVVQFLLAGVVVALEHMHMSDIIYRGLSAQTILLTRASDNCLPGYIQLVDLRYAKAVEGRTYTVVGPAEYLSPEVVGGHGATDASDWWAVGVLGYWLVTGATPFARHGDDDLRISRRISEHASSEELPLPEHISERLSSLLRGLLEPNPKQRLGSTSGGIRSLKSHAFFEGLSWEQLADGILPPPPRLASFIEHWESYLPGDSFCPAPYSGDTSWLEAF
mmetsp:Transcript_42698/g.101361  ORF Transcript_42698/g.101361 Transcript_42698/m.101361 type:complete len:1069 (-) Transcript_42698:82-3288(-)